MSKSLPQRADVVVIGGGILLPVKAGNIAQRAFGSSRQTYSGNPARR